MGVAYIFYNTGIRRRTDMKVGFIGGGNMASAMIGRNDPKRSCICR